MPRRSSLGHYLGEVLRFKYMILMSPDPLSSKQRRESQVLWDLVFLKDDLAAAVWFADDEFADLEGNISIIVQLQGIG